MLDENVTVTETRVRVPLRTGLTLDLQTRQNDAKGGESVPRGYLILSCRKIWIVHIFIDESGTFAASSEGAHSVSLVGALIVPDYRLARVEKKYAVLREDLPKQDGEVKGRLLSESEIDRVVSMLTNNEVLFEVSAIDMGIHGDADIADHKKRQEHALTARLTEDHHPNVREGIFQLRRRLERMPHQLYVQSTVTFELIARVIQHATLYYCQRHPRELAAFHWVIDGKAKDRVTDWEDWWSYVVRPLLQSKSLRKPMMMLAEGDYSHFTRFQTTIGDYLRPYISEPTDDEALDLNKLMTESIRFSSKPEPGLEMIDILANAVRRALMGNLDFAGWRAIPQLMIHQRQHYIQIVALLKSRPQRRRWSYMPVLRHFSSGGKDMIAPRFRRGAKPDRV